MRCQSSSPQNTASVVGTEATPQRKSQVRSSAICSASFALSGAPAGSASQAFTSGGTMPLELRQGSCRTRRR